MEFIGLPVFTEQGDRIGKVGGLEYDENGQIKIYRIRPKGIFGFLKKEILIYPSTIIAIDEEKMVVRGPEIKIKESAIQIKGAMISG